MAKFLEKTQCRVHGKRCLDLSAGCGLIGKPSSTVHVRMFFGADVPCSTAEEMMIHKSGGDDGKALWLLK